MQTVADSYRSFHDIVAENARRWPDRVYVHSIDQDKSLTYAALNGLANRFARLLHHKGFKAGERVLLLAENSVENLAVFVSTLRYGAALATVNVEMNQAHLGEIIAAVAPTLVLCQEGLGLEGLKDKAPGEWRTLGEWFEDGSGTGLFGELEQLSDADDIASVAGPGDPAVIFYTSGTVAKPRGVIQTHATAYYNYDATADYLGLSPGDRVLDFRSFSWLSAQHMSLGAPLVAGATTVIAKNFSTTLYFDWLAAHEINIGFVVPTVINMLLERPAQMRGAGLPHLRFLTSSSAPLLVEQWKRFEETYGITLAQSAGSSEGGNTAAHRGDKRKIGTIGPPLKYQDIRIVHEDGGECETGESGEIVVAGGRQQAFGFLMPDGSIEKLDAHGHHTGDLAFFDGDGHLCITGRVKELIIRGGVNISPVEIDGVLVELPGIAEAGTVGVPDAIWGEEVVSFVVCAAGARPSEAEIRAHCRTRLPEAKIPKRIVFRDTLPKNPRGKLDRGALAEGWEQ
jgi:acyl-coenzyme A synthetase/AMP-(fatty) acid ligase